MAPKTSVTGDLDKLFAGNHAKLGARTSCAHRQIRMPDFASQSSSRPGMDAPLSIPLMIADFASSNPVQPTTPQFELQLSAFVI